MTYYWPVEGVALFAIGVLFVFLILLFTIEALRRFDTLNIRHFIYHLLALATVAFISLALSLSMLRLIAGAQG